jgi:hypothetical protein
MTITKNSLTAMIATASPEKLRHIVGRFCVAMFRRQIESEQAQNESIVRNNRGFCAQDARQGSITAKYYIKHGTLEDWMVDQWTKTDCRGTPRMVKYWAQLNEVAEEKASHARMAA